LKGVLEMPGIKKIIKVQHQLNNFFAIEGNILGFLYTKFIKFPKTNFSERKTLIDPLKINLKEWLRVCKSQV